MNTWQFSQLKWALGLGSLMTFYGIINMAVWVLGSQFGLQVEYRVLVIALILLTMPFTLIIGYVASRRSKKKEEAAKAEKEAAEGKSADETSSEGAAPKLAKPTGNYDENEKGAEEVVQFLKSSNLGEGGKEAVYSLPWYLVLGTPKSGKSSLVIGSRLNFQTLPSQRESEQKFVRPTRSVDWRITSDAVFIDTAGRYQTEGADQDEWAALLETIKSKRPKRPLDGCLLIVNTEQVLESGEADIEQMAKILRTRLDEAIERTKVRFPVYIVFTNADTIEGFTDSFSTSKQEGRNLVWGSTIPLAKSENAQALFDSEYGLLQDAVMKRRLMRLSAPFAPVRQLRIFNFPLHFGAARRKIGAFITTLFRPNPFSASPFLRGFYFAASPSAKRSSSSGQTVQTVGNTYFTERFFRDVLLRDKDLVQTFQQQTQRAPIFGWLLTGFLAFFTIVVLVLAGVSLENNRKLLKTASERGAEVLKIVRDDKGKNPLEKAPEIAKTETDATFKLYGILKDLDEYDREGAPIYMRMGLYSGDRIFKENLLPIYFNVIEQRYKVPTIKKVEEDLQKFAKSEPVSNPKDITEKETENLNKYYDLLRAYLMLSEEHKDKANAAQIASALKDYWFASSKLPANTKEEADKQLVFWASQVDRERFPRISLNKDLVTQAQAKLKAFPAPNRFYKQKVAEISEKLDKDIGKITVKDILNRNSADAVYLSGEYVVPSAFTIEGYKMLKKELSTSGDKLSEPDWVIGETSKDSSAQTADVEKVEQLYLAEYAAKWIELVKDTKVVPYNKEKVDFAKASLNSLSSPTSPLKVLAKEIARNTNFSGKSAPQGWWEWLTSFGGGDDSVNTGGSTEVERQFLPLFTFVGSEDDKSKPPIESYESALAKVANKFDDFSTTKINQVSQELAKDDDKSFGELKDSSDKIKTMLKGFDTNAGQSLARLFQQPLDHLRALFGAGAKEQIEKNWTDKILGESNEISKSYPFENGGNDIDLKKLSDFLNPKSGTLSTFYKSSLAQYFDETNDGIKPREDSEVKFSDAFVKYLNDAFKLQKALYGNDGATPNFEYEFTLGAVKDAVVEVTIDGQKVTSEGTGSNKLTFPASSGETGVFINFASTAGTTAPAPAASPSTSTANSGNMTVSSPNSTEPLKFPGTWGLFKFFDAGNPQKQESGEYSLTYNFGGKSLTAKVKPTGGDLFDRTIFTALKAPENIFK
ncbi:MAG: type VI secretion system membrane subunit TssM [Pyrinomonadaceae bacterium]|nr:type VI secretion system membrane subunit TssM [Pyrinomonadaceae bacterium]